MKSHYTILFNNLLKSFLLGLLFLISVNTFLFAQNAPDSLMINTVNVKDILMESTRSKGLSGVEISVVLKDILTTNDSLRVNYDLNGNSYTRKFRKHTPLSLKKITIFHPFALLYQKEGEHKIVFMLKSIKDTKKNKYDIEGENTKQVTVVVPTIRSVMTKVTFTEVSEKTPKGKAWDFALFPRNKKDKYPDLTYTIQAPFNENSLGVFNGQFYKSHEQKNTLIAGWPYFSDRILYCEGDELSLCIKDNDLMFHDTIGCISIDKLISLEKTEQLQFGLVTNFSCEIVSE